MDAMRRLADLVLVLFSGLALGVLGMSGLLAAILFPTMRDLEPSLPAYGGYTGEHWSLAAGVIAERVFDIAFVVAGVSLSLCVGAVAGLVFLRGRGRWPVARLAMVLVTVSLFLTHVAWLQPRMDSAASDYRAAASSGVQETAEEAKARFDAMHPTASRLVSSSTLACLVLFVTSSVVAGRPAMRTGGPS